MHPYAVIDLHCDTLTACADFTRWRNPLDDSDAAWSLSALPRGVRWGQCFAIFLPDTLTPEEAVRCYARHQKSFVRQTQTFCSRISACQSAAQIKTAWEQGKVAAILSVENGSALAGDLARVELLARDGVRMMTLTWNGEHQLGSGNKTNHGLSDFGRAVIPTMEHFGILPDVSHLNDQGLADLLAVAQKPFLATHSNARAVCGHKRNLTDDQIRELADRGCLIGLNFCSAFLRDGGCVGLEDLLRHVDHFLELGAENCLALGSDFDGADLPAFLSTPEKACGLYQCFLGHGLPPALCDKILYGNALTFFGANLS
ncbi:MAG: membrane dipeptidase [Lawsonibacter sp.]|nr:membrane dipeptidase [Lawsonibacter sp.]